jgi:hypothetical protein
VKRLIMAVAVAASMAAMVLLAAPAMAQTTYTDAVQGFEYAAVSGQSGSFLGAADGGLPGIMNATITYTGGSPGPDVTETITGGNWTLSGPWGEVFGNFSSGTVQWNTSTTLADVKANLTVLGGSVNNIPVSSGSGAFNGVLDHRPLAQNLPPTINGTLRLVLTSGTSSPGGGGGGHHDGHHHHGGHHKHKGGGGISNRVHNG